MKEIITAYWNENFSSFIEEREEIVRCKDCAFFDNYNVQCDKGHSPKPPYDKWFCADGKLKERPVK